MYLSIKEGAFVVTDAHYSHLRPEFLNFLLDIKNKKLQPTQLILLGDIFDALFGGVRYTYEQNAEAIKLLNEISHMIEVILLEGNHDFNLKVLFPHARIYPIASQPISCEIDGKKALLAHGDFDAPFGYQLYTKIIRNSAVLKCLALIDQLFSHAILKKLDIYLSKKDDCKEFGGFEDYVKNRIDSKYECDYFIEGHYHQNKHFSMAQMYYYNLGAFACNQRFFIVKSTNKELFEEKIFSKE